MAPRQSSGQMRLLNFRNIFKPLAKSRRFNASMRAGRSGGVNFSSSSLKICRHVTGSTCVTVAHTQCERR